MNAISTTPVRGDSYKSQKRLPDELIESDVLDVEDYEHANPGDCKNPLTKRYKTTVRDGEAAAAKGESRHQSPLVMRKSRLCQLISDRYHGAVLSPVTEISLNLSDTTLGTPVSSFKRGKLQEYDENFNANDTAKLFDEDHQAPEDQVHGPSKWKEAANGCHSADNHTTDVVSNNVDLNAFSRNRTTGGGRRLLMDNNMHNTNMAIDELSFYDDDSHHSSSHAFNSSPTMMNTLLMDEDRLLSPEGSPQRFHIVPAALGKHQQHHHQQHQQQQSRRKILEPSPRINSKQSSNTMMKSTTPANSFRIFHSLSSGSMESTMDDEYMELFEMESLDDDVDENAPSNLNSLISGFIKTTKTSPELMKRPPVRRCLSLTENNCSANKARTSLFEPKTPEILRTVQDRICSTNQSPVMNTTPYSSRMAAERCFKRPEPPSTTASPIQTKRYKGELFSSAEKENNDTSLIHHVPVQMAPTQRPILRKHVSMNDADIMTALSRSSTEPDLIGDFSKPFCLPLMDGRHRDLKSISSETMAKLINGSFKDSVASYKIVDCRYPYEFEGGHIRGAKNLYTQEQIMEEFVNCKTDAATVEADGPKRHILVFHCEFSSERGPKLSRFLRNHDRASNTSTYPALHYPEIYLLHGGYKEFYESHAELCDPEAYRPMLEPSYVEAYKHFRAKSKSWNGDVKGLGGTTNRLKKSRSRLVL